MVYVGCLEYKFLESLDFHLVFLLWHSQYLEYCLAHSILTITIWDLRELYLLPYKHLCPSDLPQAFIMWTRCILYSLLGSFMVTSLRNSFLTTTSIHQKEYPNWSPRRETWDFLIVSSILDFRNTLKENATQFLREARSGVGFWESNILIRTQEITVCLLEYIPVRASALGLFCSPHGES